MTEFEFVFLIYALVLGLSLVELLAGFGRTLENEFVTEAQHRKFRIGWLTPLLGVFVLLDLLSFWIFAWSIRDLIVVTPAMLVGVVAFASAYYLAARLVFPSSPENLEDLDAHFWRVRRTVMGILFAVILAQWAFLIGTPELRDQSITLANIVLTAFLVTMMSAVMIFRNRHLQAGLLIALSIGYLFLYLR